MSIILGKVYVPLDIKGLQQSGKQILRRLRSSDTNCIRKISKIVKMSKRTAHFRYDHHFLINYLIPLKLFEFILHVVSQNVM